MAIGNKLTLADGRKITLQQLNQKLTYEGWLEGLPTIERNNRILDGLLEQHHAAVILHPSQKLLDMGGDTYPFGVPAVIPDVECVGQFRSDAIGGRDALFYSELTIIWFQAEFAMPIAPEIEGEIAMLDWNLVATNHEV